MKQIPTDIGDYLRYCPETGILFRTKSSIGKAITEYEVGSVNKAGYRTFKFHSIDYKTHRVIWFLMTGHQPMVIDHIDGNPNNNLFSNLRSRTQKDNSNNKIFHRRGKRPGVSMHKSTDKWQAYVDDAEGRSHLGLFTNLNDYACAVVANRKATSEKS